MEQWHVVAAPAPPVPATAPARRPSRVRLGLTLGLLALTAASVLVRVRAVGDGPLPVRPGPVVRTETGRAYAYLLVHSDGEPVRWNPCDPVHVVANLDNAPPTAGPDVTEALRQLAEATGLRFVYDGPTVEAPRADRPVYQPERYGERYVPLLVSWYPFSRTDLRHSANTAGLGGPATVTVGRHRRAVSGQVLLDSGKTLVPGFDNVGSDGAILLHEFAHALGLDHVDDPRELMYEGPRYAVSARVEYGTGDLAGLRALGREAGCFDVPPPSESAR